VGCASHVVHDAVKTTVEFLLMDIVLLAVYVYQYFHIYAACVQALKDVCDLVDMGYTGPP
jgi:hypothetical protein